MTSVSARLDAFTDAAFAFAVTVLMVSGGMSTEGSDADLMTIVRRIPAFGIGYVIVGMFWFAHVRWRRFRGEGDWRSVLLTFLLIFVVLIYIFPLGAMATDLSSLIFGEPDPDRPSVRMLFTVYGVGFFAMSATTSLLFWDAFVSTELDPALRSPVKGEAIIYAILAGTAVVSTALAMAGGSPAFFAPFIYASLPITIGVFSWFWHWGDTPA
ncbi:TMEM175 family protein [Sphingomonas crocodyli]|uniref:DUF1211 domain-containing protein n=1 Tax=Sphingomonas crocodyli TaxID=1979270 RepID=A0A437LZQ2_9SPHN|nr:TMEM175 family protein [Sphingomonas crocodyli]RVT90845.1 DUF1211 domain-containing protein [Sphingomonas crocodyli]